MPGWGRRGSYVGVTTTIVALAAVGAFVKCNKDLIPPHEENELAGNPSQFLRRGGRQGIDWLTTEDSPFVVASRLNKPVMVFAGTTASQAARKYDDALFTVPEVWARLNRDFVCVRVDLSQEPEWRSAFLPVRRNEVGADPGLTIWFFKPNGQLLTWIGRRTWANIPDYNDFLGSLTGVKDLFAATSPDEWTLTEQEQHDEVVALKDASSRTVPDLDSFFALLDQPRVFFIWQPGRYLTLLQAGRNDEAARLLLQDLTTPRADLIDGGFFRIGSWQDPMLVEFDKLATTNAGMLLVLARAYLATGDPTFQYWYERTLDCIENQFMSPGALSSYIQDTVAEDGRSARNSVSVATLRLRASDAVRSYASDLGLDPSRNALMVPYLVDPHKSLRNRKKLDEVVHDLQATTKDERRRPNDRILDATGMIIARTLEAGRLMGDLDAQGRAMSWARDLTEFRAGTDDVVHSTLRQGSSRKWLGDYAAYADAMLQAYTTSGETALLEDGHKVLLRAIELFERDTDGDIVSVSGLNDQGGPLRLEMPSIVDDGPPPALPWFVRVCFRYGAVLGDPMLRARAVRVAERFSGLANSSPAAFSSFFAVAQEAMVTGCVVVEPGAEAPLLADRCVLLAGPDNSEIKGKRALAYAGATYRVVSLPAR